MLARHGVRPDKALGQHFLVSDSVVSKIVARCEGLAGVLEVGPGPGVLTRPLALLGLQVTAVEIDTSILGVLAEMAPTANVVQGDALTTDLASLLGELTEPRGIVSNMPYNITGPLLGVFASCRHLCTKAVLMMQREVAEKILALPGDRTRGSLSVALQAQFKITKVCNVPPGAFLPPPKVDSIVLECSPSVFADGEEELTRILAIVRTGFTQPRKTLHNNLVAQFGAEETRRRIAEAGLDERIRPHQLTWDEWLRVVS